MFANHDSEVAGFDSKSVTDKPKNETPSQTNVIETIDKSTSSESTQSTQTQTSSIDPKHETSDDELVKLAAWLKRIYPLVEEQLVNIDSEAFENYNPKSDLIEIQTKQLHQLKPSNPKTYVSALTWNCTGNTLACAYCEKHESICVHDNHVQIYMIDGNGIYKDPPSNLLLAPACVTSLEYHPTEPSLLIGGSTGGQLLLWTPTDKRKEMILTKSEMGIHKDGITQVRWHKNRDDANYWVVTAGLDGFFITWDVDLHSKLITIKQKFIINIPQVGLRSERGVKCFSFSLFEPESFVVGVEGGDVLRCSLNGPKSIIIDDETYLNPVISKYEKHDGDVKSIQFSPHRPQLFMSCGSDGQVHIYDVEQENVFQTIYAKNELSCIYWVPSERKFGIGCSENGDLKIFHLEGSGKEVEISNDNPGLTSMTFNNKSINKFAIGDQSGHVQIWNIPWNKICHNY